MSVSDELLNQELREGFARLAGEAPTRADVAAARASGRRSQRLQRLMFAAPVALLLLIGTVTVDVIPRGGDATLGPAQGVTTPAPAAGKNQLPSLGRVGNYVATYLPDTTVKPVRSDPLAFEGGRCSEVNAAPSATSGCWSPAQCQAGASITTNNPCNVGLRLEITTDETAYRQLKVGTSNPEHSTVTAVTVLGRPGFLEETVDFFTAISWRLADGRIAQARGANFGAADVLAFANGLDYRPSPDAPTAAPTTPAPSPTTVPVNAVDARPASSPPPVEFLNLPRSGSQRAFAGDGWFLGIGQGDRGAASVAISDGAGHGHGHSSAFVYSEVYTSKHKEVPLPLKGLLAVTAADFQTGGVHHLVVSGGVPRGTTGVGVLDVTGHRGWATLIDPGKAFDTLFFAYEPPTDAAITGMQSFGSAGPTGAQLAPFPNEYPTDPAAASEVTRSPGSPVVLAGLTVSNVPAGVTIGVAPCSPNNGTATQACWGGKITDYAAAKQALTSFGVASRLLDVTVSPGISLAGTSGTTTEARNGVTVTELEQGAAVVISFTTPGGKDVLIRGINLPRAGVLAVADSLIG